MYEALNPILELTVIIPGLLLAYFPMKHHMRMPLFKLVSIFVPTLSILCILGGGLCYKLNIDTFPVLLILCLITGIFYLKTLNVSRLRSLNVIIAICAVFTCLNSATKAINYMYTPGAVLWLNLKAGLFYNLLCCLFTVIAWYPASHAVVELLDDELVASTWYYFWVLPIVFIELNLFMIPDNPEVLHLKDVMQGYVATSLMLLAILCLFYALFYTTAMEITKNDRLLQENQFLSMQQAQYNNLVNAIEETREARHDMRHHFSALSILVKQEKWDEVESYLERAQTTIPDTELLLCLNPAVNGVAGHYAALFRKYGVPYTMKLALPEQIPVPEMELCLVLSNLLENALEASLRTNAEKRSVRVLSHLHSEHILLLTVENTFDGTVQLKNDIFQSSKRHGNGIGIQSVRRIAEKNNGYCQFSYENGVFEANVMLRGTLAPEEQNEFT